MFVEWRCIQNAAVCFVYTLEESYSRHAIHCLLHLALACMREIPALTQVLASIAPHTRSYLGTKSIRKLHYKKGLIPFGEFPRKSISKISVQNSKIYAIRDFAFASHTAAHAALTALWRCSQKR